ncbi:MAG: hypothetical protein ACRCV0_05070 [Brevinema sp.]
MQKKKFFLIVAVMVLCIIVNFYAQEIPKLFFSAGNLAVTVDNTNGRFGLRNTKEKDFNLISLLYDTGFPSSYIEVYIDGKPYRLEDMKAIYPLGVAVGAQIDGIYQWQDDLQLEIGYFGIDLKTNLDAVGIAVRVSNISERKKYNVSVNVLLDTDISEVSNQSMTYLDSGELISKGIILNKPNLPQYLFFGYKSEFNEKTQGQGMYLYPTISTNTPRVIAVGNWKKITESGSFPQYLDESLQYNSDSSIDLGVGIYFEEKVLVPNAYYDVATAISLNLNQANFILDQTAMNRGVFSPERFEIEELLPKTPPAVATNPALPAIQYHNNAQLQRQQYRQKLLHNDSSSGVFSTNIFDYLGNTLRNDSIWRYLFELNFKMNNVEEKIDHAIKDDE